MRIYFKTTPNTTPVPFTYQTALVGALHKWLDHNEHHDRLSLYSLSWLYHGRGSKNGLHFPEGSGFFISSPSEDFIAEVIRGVLRSPEIRYGMHVTGIDMQATPDFGEQRTFFLQSPVLIKRTHENVVRFYYPQDEEADLLLTETLRRKLRSAGQPDLPVHVRFDRQYPHPKTRLVQYKGTDIKATYCPVVIEGDPAALAFAWDVGVGNSTGMGFGALR